MNNLRIVISRLLENLETINIEYGICTNLNTGFGELKTFKTHEESLWFHEACTRWPYYSGYYYHPVPDPDGGCPIRVYESTDNKWTGSYGQLRLDLLNFLYMEINSNENRN